MDGPVLTGVTMYEINTNSPFSNQTMIGCAMVIMPHLIFTTTPEGEFGVYGLVASMMTNITWSLGMKFKAKITSDGHYGSVDVRTGKMTGGFADINSEVADVITMPSVVNEDTEFLFPRSAALPDIDFKIVSGFQQPYQKLQGFAGGSSLFFEIYPLLIAFIVVLNFLSVTFNVLVRREKTAREYLSIFFWMYVQSFFYEASNTMNSEASSRLTYSSKILFGGWTLGVFILSNYIQTTLKSSYMVQVETERIKTTKDIIDRPNFLPLMHADVPYILKGFNTPYVDELTKQYNRLPEAQITFLDYYTNSTLNKVATGRGGLFTDELGFIYMLRDICRRIKGYFYMPEETPATSKLAWFYKRSINRTLVKEIDKRYQWVTEAAVPWVPRHLLQASGQSCSVAPLRGFIFASDDKPLTIDDLSSIMTLLGFGLTLSLLSFLGEYLSSRCSCCKCCNCCSKSSDDSE